MIAPAHYAIGAASALFIQKHFPAEFGSEIKILCALAIAIVSHIVADAIPHAEHFLKGRYLVLELVVETMVMLAVLVGASRSPFVATIILAGMTGAAIPDGFNMLGRCIDWPLLSWINSRINFFHGKLNFFYANFTV